MAKETTKVEGQQASEGAQSAGAEQKSARERYRERYSAAHPDLNLDDEDAFYGQANANLDELENFRSSNNELGAAFDKTPLLAGLVLAAKEGENPFVYLAENIGPDMDVRELANDPEFGKKMGDALAKYQEHLAQGAKRQKEQGENFEKSMTALKELQQERGMSDEDTQALVRKLFGSIDDDGNMVEAGIIGDASMGIVSKETWEAVLKAQNYDNDVAAAGDKARATALNEKVQNPLRKDFGNNGLPGAIGTGSGPRPASKKRDDGSLKSFGESILS